MKTCQGEGCTNKLLTHDPNVYCETCRKKRDPADEPDDRVSVFCGLGFGEVDALSLALAGADPKVVAYRLEACGMTLDEAVAIYS